MTRRRTLHAHDLPALRAFARAYLHEDLAVEHGGGVEAAAAFAREASDEERRLLVDELERLDRALAAWPLARLSRLFAALGAAWTPASAADVRAMIDRLRGAVE